MSDDLPSLLMTLADRAEVKSSLLDPQANTLVVALHDAASEITQLRATIAAPLAVPDTYEGEWTPTRLRARMAAVVGGES